MPDTCILPYRTPMAEVPFANIAAELADPKQRLAAAKNTREPAISLREMREVLCASRIATR